MKWNELVRQSKTTLHIHCNVYSFPVPFYFLVLMKNFQVTSIFTFIFIRFRGEVHQVAAMI